MAERITRRQFFEDTAIILVSSGATVTGVHLVREGVIDANVSSEKSIINARSLKIVVGSLTTSLGIAGITTTVWSLWERRRKNLDPS